jgi:hypothetical protein
MSAMEKNSERRFKDAGEFAKALENGLSQGAVRPLGVLPPRDRRINPLQLWQGLTFLFATAFFVLLIVLLCRR